MVTPIVMQGIWLLKWGPLGLLAPIIEIQLKKTFSKIIFRMKIQLHEQKYICTDKTHTIYWNLNHWSPQFKMCFNVENERTRYSGTRNRNAVVFDMGQHCDTNEGHGVY